MYNKGKQNSSLYPVYGHPQFYFSRYELAHTCNPFRSIPPVTYLYAFVGSKWEYSIVSRCLCVRSFIHCLCADEKIIVRQFGNSNKMNELSAFSSFSLSLFLSIFCTFEIFVWLYWKSTCNRNITFRNLGSFSLKKKISVEETTRNMQSAHRINMIDFMTGCVPACVFCHFFLFRLTSFTDYGWKCSSLLLTWHGIHEWMNECEWMNDPNIHSHFVKMAFSQVKVIFSLFETRRMLIFRWYITIILIWEHKYCCRKWGWENR